MKFSTRVAVIAAASALAVGLAACSSAATSSSTAKEPGSVAGPAGDPIVFYDITDATGLGAVSAAISQFTTGELAAQDHINAQGGVGGRPIKIVKCDSKADPAATTACAQEAVQNKAVAKLGLSVAWGENGFPVLARAGVPSLNPPVNPQDLQEAGNSYVTGGSSEYEAQVYYAGKTLAAKSAVVFTDENPSGQDQVARVTKAVQRYGFDMTVTPVYLPSGTADPTPFVAKAVSGKPDVVFTNQSGAQAVSAYTAFHQQGFPTDRILNQGGAADFDSFFTKVSPEIADGTIFSYAYQNPDDLSDPQVKLYRDAMQQYAGRDGKSEFSQWGFANVMTLAEIAKKIGPEKFDAASLKAFLTTVDNFPMFMAQPLSRKYATPDAPANLRPQIQVLQYKGGKLETVQPWFNPYDFMNRAG
ncbi:hypothetical protein DMP17_16160 [Pseudonocardia sp. TMWB2A]|uniref:ABC transporter substrate-binding protein n=1 Tax=unclassified Pseudonocardia TaxID=2619320 RepID=UPI001CF64AD9|nr:ABC transporter substrate-binding protein [Pseudonocardia sp. ICBG162]